MKRWDLATSVQLLGWFSFAMVAYGDERLITSPGSYTNRMCFVASTAISAKAGKLSLEVKSPDLEHVKFKVGWTLEETDSTGLKAKHKREWSQGLDQPLPVIRDRWAFCMARTYELWFYDGDRTFLCYKGTSEGLISCSGCSDPKVSERAPQALKRWAWEKSRTMRWSELPSAGATDSRSP